MWFLDIHKAFEAHFDEDPSASCLHLHVAGTWGIRENRFHPRGGTHESYPGIRVQPARARIGTFQYLYRPIRERDHARAVLLLFFTALYLFFSFAKVVLPRAQATLLVDAAHELRRVFGAAGSAPLWRGP